ncbi:carboxypeptidase-like regulatory domain-containing protein [Tenacibaculum ovolyticum]|uniref:carboxypeptidase-like regulatory domain-containing protein n=1 Tax=Tenacibaculum ovolyticum TaxID=104270 RepID=UPI0022F3B864|nr:carboxypeptidase-like regulatory domain-containing protein [Tenacibaculum ovolyticum]WBX78276.1 carboxypeptidase-like regulatory domain-containing protein [Tenacibaculum ovolyticum]
MNKISLIFLFIIPITIKAQQKRQFLYAKVHDKIDKVCNAHIINLNTKQGTFTNEFGEFRILAKNNDSLRISFIGYKTAIIIIKNNHFGMLKNNFILEKETYELDEVILKKHNLFGFLSRDMKQTPDDVAIVKSKSAFDFSMIDFEKKLFQKLMQLIDQKLQTCVKKLILLLNLQV